MLVFFKELTPRVICFDVIKNLNALQVGLMLIASLKVGGPLNRLIAALPSTACLLPHKEKSTKLLFNQVE